VLPGTDTGSGTRLSKLSGFCGKLRPGSGGQGHYRWRRDYGRLKLDQAKRLKDLQRENDRLKNAVSEWTWTS
jgi:hypothetical protein